MSYFAQDDNDQYDEDGDEYRRCSECQEPLTIGNCIDEGGTVCEDCHDAAEDADDAEGDD